MGRLSVRWARSGRLTEPAHEPWRRARPPRGRVVSGPSPMRDYRPFATLRGLLGKRHGRTPGHLRARLLDRAPRVRERGRQRVGVHERRGRRALPRRVLAVLGRAPRNASRPPRSRRRRVEQVQADRADREPATAFRCRRSRPARISATAARRPRTRAASCSISSA